MRLVLANVRTPEERRGDLNAQLAALRVGEARLKELAERFGADGLIDGLAEILDYSERRMLKRMEQLPPGRYVAEDWLDDDGSSPEKVLIRVTVDVTPERLVFDFAGSAPQRRGNVNAVAPMTHSAVFYAIKILTDATLPPNAGVLRPVEIRIPSGSFLDAQPPAAVCAGNTETTQRIADTVLRAFAAIDPGRIAAASQGTMNLIGVGGRDPRNGRSYTYIETIGGGQGGRPYGPGMHGVHANMSNTLNTPIEALEISYPLRVDQYELREQSGGDGLHKGGEGLIRALTVIDHEARVSVLSERRVGRPYGLNGGQPGANGRNVLVKADGTAHDLPGKASVTLRANDTIVINTPGGGGWNRPEPG
jgi:N-methylhydantoinase B